jgi:chromosome partitioning protein
MIIAVINQKGGTGKTSTAVHLAYWLSAKRGETVQLIDADAQASSSTWLGFLPDSLPCHVLLDPNDLAERIPELVSATTYTVIDGAGSLSESTRVILYYANIALIPCQPTALDLHSSNSVIRLIRQAKGFRGDSLKAAVFLSRAIPRTRLKDEAREALNRIEGVTLLDTIVHQRQAIADAFGQGSVVWQMGGDAAKAADEYESLCEEVMTLCRERS